jgi:membrane protease YdiL (CAAX protease family)
MKRYLSALVPLWVLLGATFLACLAGFFIVHGLGADIPLRTIIKKATQIFLVFSIFPLMAVLQLGKADVGFAPRAVFLKQLLKGFGLGFITLIPVFILLTVLGVNVIDESQPWTGAWIGKKLLLELLLALLIGFFEESVFRGILLAGLRKTLPVTAALLISAFYYASLHFLDSQTLIPAQELHLFSGFQLVAEAVVNMFNPAIRSALLALFMVGICLGVLRTQLKESLGYCIGCHASWVWQIKLNKSFFNTDYSADYAYLVSSYDGVIGPLVTGWLLLSLVVFFAYRWISRQIPADTIRL